MTDIISIQVSGNLTRDAERVNDSYYRFSLASNFWDKSSSQERPIYFSCYYFTKAENLVLLKGYQVFLSGRMIVKDYQAKDGSTKQDLCVFVNELKIGKTPEKENPPKIGDENSDIPF